jgi:hypothetical protein
MSDLRYVSGLVQLSAALKGLPAKVATKVLRHGVMAGAERIIFAARSNAPIASGPIRRGKGKITQPGTLRNNIIAKFVARDSNATQVQYIVTVRKGKRFAGRDAFYGSWVEFGHRIVPRKSKAHPGSIRFRRNSPALQGSVPGRRYLTRAVNAVHNQATDAMVRTIKMDLAKLPEFK